MTTSPPPSKSLAIRKAFFYMGPLRIQKMIYEPTAFIANLVAQSLIVLNEISFSPLNANLIRAGYST